MSRTAPVGRCATVWLVATASAGLLVAALAPDLLAGWASPPAGERVEAWLVLGCESVALVVTGWLWLLVVLVVLEARRDSGPQRAVPAPVRRLVLVACGAGLVTGLVAPAQATPPPDAHPTPARSASPTGSPLAGLPLPDRPAPGRAAAASSPLPTPITPVTDSAATASGDQVRVEAGDSLWSIAAAGLPADAPVTEVDRRWRAIHAANRSVVGDDPDLILPGQRLRLPPVDPPA